jgi:predicted MFS family arabinose efflux permease
MHTAPTTLDYRSATPERGFNWPLISLLTAIATLNYCDRMAIFAVYPLLRSDLGADDRTLGWIGSMFLWAYAIGSPFSGLIADRWSRTRVILVSLVAWSVITLATGLTRTAGQLIVMRFLLGVAECAYLPAAVGLLADHHGPRRRGRAISVHTMGLNVGAILGSALAGFLGVRYGWRSSFVLLGAAGLLLSAVAAYGLRGQDVPHERPEPSSPDDLTRAATSSPLVPSLFAVPGYWIVVAQGMLAAAAVWVFGSWLPLYFTERFNMSLAGAGFLGPALLDVSGMLGVILGGLVSDAAARRGSARRMFVQTCCYTVAAALLLAFTDRAAFLLIATAVFGFSLLRAMASANEGPLACDLVAPRDRSFAIGLMNCANTAAGAAGILAAGYLKADYGLTSVFRGASLVIFASAALTLVGFLYVLPRDLRRRDAAAGRARADAVPTPG